MEIARFVIGYIVLLTIVGLSIITVFWLMRQPNSRPADTSKSIVRIILILVGLSLPFLAFLYGENTISAIVSFLHGAGVLK